LRLFQLFVQLFLLLLLLYYCFSLVSHVSQVINHARIHIVFVYHCSFRARLLVRQVLVHVLSDAPVFNLLNNFAVMEDLIGWICLLYLLILNFLWLWLEHCFNKVSLCQRFYVVGVIHYGCVVNWCYSSSSKGLKYYTSTSDFRNQRFYPVVDNLIYCIVYNLIDNRVSSWESLGLRIVYCRSLINH
jgi:hypothetical protein